MSAADTDKAGRLPAPEPARLRLVTGLSGAGKSTALKVMEDLGHEVIDNLPIKLVATAVAMEAAPGRALAIGVDARARDFDIDVLSREIETLKRRADLETRLLFLDCDDEVLRQRFTETRRRHPLAADRPVSDGIRRERALMAPLQAGADLTVDTSGLSAADLRRLLSGHFATDAGPTLSVFVTSFAFRHGVPREADLVFDVRFLRNPHYVDKLRPQTGRDAAVIAYVEGDPDFAGFFARLEALLVPLLPRYKAEGKSYLTVAVGCTGGRHRSVVVAERLAARLQAAGAAVQVQHRDVDRATPAP